MGTSNSTKGKRLRGFALLDAEKMRQIASMGGKTAHQAGRAHQFTSAEARAAGRKGGAARAANRKARG